MVPAPELKADAQAIRKDLEYMTARWHELPEPAVFELRAFKEGFAPKIFKYSVDWMDDAVECVVNMNGLGYNIYVVRNPIRHTVTGSATDDDIIAAFFLWADCDDPESAGNVHRFDGPKWSAAVTTGRTPSVRVHTYWALKEPCLDMAAWRAMQMQIAAHFGSDRSVINPSRIMRVGGTVSHPFKKKVERGYVPELTTIRTEYDEDRAPVTLDQMARVFGSSAPAALPLSQQAMPSAPRSQAFEIDTGEAPRLDRERLAIQAMQGQEWHNAVIRLVASYVGKGLSDAEIHALTQPLTLSGYTADETYREVQTAIDGARRKGWTPEATQEQPAPQVQAMQTQAEDAKEAEWPTLYDFFDEDALAPRQWVYGKHYLRRFVSVLASAGGIGKTSMQIVEALAICTGKPLLGETVHEPCPVWIINLEDPIDEMQRRILAAMKYYGIKPEDVRGKLFVDAGRDFAITFAVQTREGVIPNLALVDHLKKRIPELGIGCVFIDPFVGAHQINENDNMAVNAVVAQVRAVADETNTAIGLVHHIRKGNGEDATIDSVRGAGSLIGAARAARVINRVSPEDAVGLGVSQDDSIGIFRVDDGKANLAPPARAAVFRRMHGVQIANGEWVGVATPFELPDEWAGMTTDVVNEILSIIRRGIPDAEGNEEYYSSRPQDKDRWVGNVLMTFAFDCPDHAKNEGQSKRIIQQWLKNGLLIEGTYHSAKQRKDRKGIVETGRVGDAE